MWIPDSCIQDDGHWNVQFFQGFCHLSPGHKENMVCFSKIVFQEDARTQFTSSGRSPGWVRLWLSYINGEAFLFCRRLLQHPEDDSGVGVSQDFLRRTQRREGSERPSCVFVLLVVLILWFALMSFKDIRLWSLRTKSMCRRELTLHHTLGVKWKFAQHYRATNLDARVENSADADGFGVCTM